MDVKTLRAKFRGALLGAAIGDALEAVLASSPPTSLDDVGQIPEPASSVLRYTGDTQMMLGVAESLVECRRFDSAHMAARLAARLAAQPWRGYGGGPLELVRRLGQAVSSSHDTGDDASAERRLVADVPAAHVSPVALLTCPRLPEAAWLARQVALLTVRTPALVDAAVLQACALTLLLQLIPQTAPDTPRLLGMLRTPLHGSPLVEELERLGQWLYSAERLPRSAGPVENTGDNPMSGALLAFFRTPRSFRSVVTSSIRPGAAAARTGPLAGALAGAYLGEEEIPSGWRQHIDGAERIRTLADELFGLATSGISVRSGRRYTQQ